MISKLNGAKERLDFMFTRNDKVVMPRSKKYECGLGCNMYVGKSERVFNYKLWQLNYLGVMKVTVREAVEHLMGEQPTDEFYEPKASPYEFVFNHHKDREEENEWSSKATIYELKKKKWRGLWFKKELEWAVKHGKLRDIEVQPPPAMMLRVFETRSVKMFNTYSSLVNGERILLIGQVWEFPPTFCGPNVKYQTSGSIAHFYLGDWSLT